MAALPGKPYGAAETDIYLDSFTIPILLLRPLKHCSCTPYEISADPRKLTRKLTILPSVSYSARQGINGLTTKSLYQFHPTIVSSVSVFLSSSSASAISPRMKNYC